LYSDASVYATTNLTEYPFGNQLWHFHAIHCKDEDEDGGFNEEVILSLNICKDDEFNCDDGSCVLVDQVFINLLHKASIV
jgi:hypothetical protein